MPRAPSTGGRWSPSSRSSSAQAAAGGHLPGQDAALAAAALVGALIEGLIGPLAPAAGGDPAKVRAQVQMLTLFALRGLGVVDARARGLVVQTVVPEAGSAPPRT